MEYKQFLEAKKISIKAHGIDIDKSKINTLLFDFQKDIVVWSLKKGRACIFAGTGLGKTLIQLEWAKHIVEHTNGNILIIAPLAVSQQTVKEGKKLDVSVNLCKNQNDVIPGINITNYERLHKFDANSFVGIVLDESSILKSFTGKIRNIIIESFMLTPYKLACIATPAPNDHMELGNHAEFVGVMSYSEMLAMFFVHDGGDTAKWRLKGHAKKDFWMWVSSWAVMLSDPKDLGYDDNRFELPRLNIVQDVVDKSGFIVKEAKTMNDRRKVRKDSIGKRVSFIADIVNNSSDTWIVWCDLNAESDMIKKAIDGSVEIRGSHDIDYKEKMMNSFSDGNIRVLVTKPSIAGFGMNWQHCSNIAFVGLSDSFERYYQAVRRCWRFGQTKQVNVHIITSEKEGAVVKNIKRKEKDFKRMLKGMIANTQEFTRHNIKTVDLDKSEYKTDIVETDRWSMHLGDCIDVMSHIPDGMMDYSVFSPPFSSLYTYSDSMRDMGNSKTHKEFLTHFSFFMKEMFRVLKSGRLISVHCMNLPLVKQRDGVIGLRDFRGELIKAFTDVDFIYHSEVCIWKNPVTAMQRTKALGLLHKQIKKDSSMCRQGIPDYLVTFRKPGENLNRIEHTNDSFPVYEWQQYASPIWMDINQSDTLQRTSARENEDERHICPLQLEVIRRALMLWTNENDLVFSPFAGIGSECYEAVKAGRRAYGIELKQSYWKQAVLNMKEAERLSNAPKQITFDAFMDKEKKESKL